MPSAPLIYQTRPARRALSARTSFETVPLQATSRGSGIMTHLRLKTYRLPQVSGTPALFETTEMSTVGVVTATGKLVTDRQGRLLVVILAISARINQHRPILLVRTQPPSLLVINTLVPCLTMALSSAGAETMGDNLEAAAAIRTHRKPSIWVPDEPPQAFTPVATPPALFLMTPRSSVGG